MPKKVYDLAKEYGVVSKDFVPLLQQAKIPVKSHMSILTDQQEKYFKNNYGILDGKLVSKAEAEAKQSAKARSDKPAAEPVKKQEEKPAAKAENPRSEQSKPTSSQQTRPTAAQPSQNSRESTPAARGNTQGNSNYQRREGQNTGGYQQRNTNTSGGNNQQRNSNQSAGDNRQRTNTSGGNNQRREGQNTGSYQQRNTNTSGGNYQQRNNQTGGSYQQRNSNTTGGNYQRRDGQNTGSYQQRNTNTSGGNYQQRNNQSGGSYQQRNTTGGNYQQRNNQTGGSYQQRNNQTGTNRYQGNNNRPNTGRTNAAKPVEEKPLEKPKTDRYKNRATYNNDKNKAKDTFFSEDKTYIRPDNAKKKRGTKSEYKKQKLDTWEKRATSGVDGVVVLPDYISVADLSDMIYISTGDIMKKLMEYGMMVTINQTLDYDTVAIICEELGISVELEQEPDYFENMLAEQNSDEAKLITRPPIITVMGHVDHGKTSLLDAIRDTDVFGGEKGGITQHIGAYTVSMRDKMITFIDTPGHKAFTAMRARGADVTDIVVLVVAADDGIMPQTIEAINHAKAAKVPIIVAINKIDKPDANPQRVMDELTQYNLVPESWGGDTICVNVSAKTGEGLSDLLDNILLLAEVENYRANFEGAAIGTVIESRIDKQRGVTTSLLVKSGTLRAGNFIVINTIYGKIRSMSDWTGKKVDQAIPSTAVEVLGLPEVPAAGDKFIVAADEKEAKRITDKRKDRISLQATRATTAKTLDDMFSQIKEGEMKDIDIIVKTDVAGSVEAIKQEIEALNVNDDNIKLSVIHSGVGDVSETDIMLAAASHALIIVFNAKADNNIRAMAEKEAIEIKTYSIIYEIVDDLKAKMKGMKDPVYEEIVTGQGEVRAVYRIPDLGPIAGSYITDGAVKRSDKIRVFRAGKIIHEGKISSLKRFKDDVREVAAGYECGIGIEKFDGMAQGDKLEFSTMRLKEED